jgi:hypothetical protein
VASEYDDTTPAIPWPVKLAFVILIAFGVWLAIGLIFTTLRLALAFAGYIIVAFLAYQVGKWVGRNSSGPEP